MAAFMGVLGSGPVNGVLLGAAISIVLLLRQAAQPRVTELARVAGTTHFSDRVRHPENDTTPGVFVVRCEASLLYFNVEYVRDRLFELLAARQDAVRLVVFYLGVVPRIDLAGAELLADLQRTFLARGVAFRVADVHGEVRSCASPDRVRARVRLARVRPDRPPGRVGVAGLGGSRGGNGRRVRSEP